MEQIELPPSLVQKYKLLEIKKGEVECLQDKIRQDREALRCKNEILRSVIARAKAEERKEQENQRKIKDAQEEASLRTKAKEVTDRARDQATKNDFQATLAAIVEQNETILCK